MTQLALDLTYRAASGREDFMVSDCNAHAVTWIDRWRDWPLGRLAIHGPPGCGKSHLLQVWREVSGARELPFEALRSEGLDAWVGEGALLALDGADRVAGNPEAERALFHLINLVAEQQGRLLLLGQDAPARWPVKLADLQSRLAGTASVAIAAPDDGLMAGLLLKLFSDRQTPLDPEAIPYIVARMERSFSAARDLVRELDRLALAERKRVTVPVARRVLAAAGQDGEDC